MGRTRDVVASRIFEAMAHLVSRKKQKDHTVTYTRTHTYVRPASLGNIQLWVYAACTTQQHLDVIFI